MTWCSRSDAVPTSIAQLRHADIDIAVVQDWPEAPLTVPEGISCAPVLEDVLDVALPPNIRSPAGPPSPCPSCATRTG